ncbi:MAG: SOS response-associated peptidase [Planctomycetaceae bacterium]|nr:SOS response-associated peptidase [Planctomycetaceae bacterium]
MCGRYTLKTPAPQLVEIFDVADPLQLSPRFNIAPTQLVLCVLTDGDADGPERHRYFANLRWGLIPSWSRTDSGAARMIKARSETIAEKPAFRSAFRQRRCLIPADGFFEWEKRSDGSRQPWYLQLQDQSVFAMAGIWEIWHPHRSDSMSANRSGAALSSHTVASDLLLRPQDSAPPAAHSTAGTNPFVWSCAVLTTTANSDVEALHQRMPVILPVELWDTWLNPDSDAGRLLEVLQPLPAGSLFRHRVTRAMGTPSFTGPECVQPLPEQTAAPRSETTSSTAIETANKDPARGSRGRRRGHHPDARQRSLFDD